MPMLSNEAIIEAVNKRQRMGGEYALRCDNDNCWDILKPVVKDNKVILVCTKCQAEMPPYKLSNFILQVTATSSNGELK